MALTIMSLTNGMPCSDTYTAAAETIIELVTMTIEQHPSEATFLCQTPAALQRPQAAAFISSTRVMLRLPTLSLFMVV